MEDETLGTKLRFAYKKLRTPLIYALVATSFVLRFAVGADAAIAVLIPILLLILPLIFEVHEKVVEEAEPNRFNSFHDSSSHMAKHLSEEMNRTGSVHIKVLGISLYHTWTFLDGQLTRFLHDRTRGQVSIEISVIDPDWDHSTWINPTVPGQTRAALDQVIDFARRNRDAMDNRNWEFSLFKYRFTPQSFGIVINDKTLFLGSTVWDGGRLRGGHNSVELIRSEESLVTHQKLVDFLGWFEKSKSESIEL